MILRVAVCIVLDCAEVSVIVYVKDLKAPKTFEESLSTKFTDPVKDAIATKSRDAAYIIEDPKKWKILGWNELEE